MQRLLRDLKEAEGSENALNDDALEASSSGEDVQQGAIQLADEATKTQVRSALLLLLHVQCRIICLLHPPKQEHRGRALH